MDSETVALELEPEQDFACCVAFLGHVVGHWMIGVSWRESLAESEALDGFELETIDGQQWLVQNGCVVLRPARVDYLAESVGPSPEVWTFRSHPLSDAVEDACRAAVQELVAKRDAKGWAVGIGQRAAHGETLEVALRKLVQVNGRNEQARD